MATAKKSTQSVTPAEAEKEYKRLQAFLSDISKIDLTKGRVGSVTIRGVKYSLDQLRTMRSDAQKSIDALDAVLAPVREAQAKVQQAEEIARNPITGSATGMSEQEAQAQLVAAQETLKRAVSRPVDMPTTTTAPAATAGRGGQRIAAPTAAEFEGRKAAGAAADKAAGKKPSAFTTPTAPTTGTTGGTTATTPAETPKKAKPSAPSTAWETTFRSMFPGQSWLLDIDRSKYPGLFKTLQAAVDGKMWETSDGLARFSTQLDGTDFYVDLKNNNIIRDIKSTIGDLGFDTTPFNAFVTKAMNMGWKGDNLKFETYKEAFRKDDTTGQYANPTAVDRVKKSTPWLSIAKIGTDFFSQVPDQTIINTLIGTMSQDDVLRQQRELAKTKYAHLANLIDQGFTMDDLSSSFKNTAAKLLEVDPNTINMADTKWETALNYGEPDKKRMLTNGEWEKLLRTDKQYNWDKTENAKVEARQLANTISQAFGRVL